MNKITTAVGVILVAALAAIGFTQFRNQDNDQNMAGGTQSPTPTSNPTQTPGSTATPNTGSTTPPTAANKYKDGTFSAQGTYRSPAMQETVDISLTVKDDRIVSAIFTGNGTNPTTIKLQGQFKAGFEQAVVGKKIDEVNLTVVNGSSLTPKGFADALAKIKVQAQS